MEYRWKHKQICWSGTGLNSGVDFVFNSKDEFNLWYKAQVAYFAELDEYMNYCKYFVREKNNDGYYERDNKRCPVNGLTTSYELGLEKNRLFKDFLIENGWESNWFELRDKYKSDIEEAKNIKYFVDK